ncbi:hypothetical protein IFT98_03210 [Pseudomonas sp. CFBP 8770]|uniref:bestrophin-like domain n=1 Tax=unclassified Pseudomonas TaxID=196821 RepID=UPI0017835A1C|nr:MULTISPECIES: hypothetical protein [unclassified Pseudomonas]MBD8472907.1 hypothetical protein [Pseudomonas sp. CFBP 8773]MBD8645990.1 hypothetical protein [Pseudomonas sp. CFBP 8770]
MTHYVIALAVFLCVFGSALIGLYLRHKLPEHHLGDDSVSVVKLATGLIATLAALVLSLLISSAKATYDTTASEVIHNAAMVIHLDRDLARYGPQTNAVRTLLKHNYAQAVDILESGESATLSLLGGPQAIARSETLQAAIEALTPANPSQQNAKAQSLQLVDQIFAARWLVLLQVQGSIPMPLLMVLVAWLSTIFGCFGLFAKANGTVMVALLMCALSVAAAVFMIEEMSRPLDGLVKVSVAPMRNTLERMGQ